MNRVFRKTSITFLFFLVCTTACSGILPAEHFPQREIPKDQLKDYIISFCWRNPDGRQSESRPYDQEVVVVVQNLENNERVIIRNELNLDTANLSDFYIYKNGCVDQNADLFRYRGSALRWRPNSDEITFVEGSDWTLTRFDGYIVTSDLKISKGDFDNWVKGYEEYFLFPQDIYWSPDGRRMAAVGLDANRAGPIGYNLWIHSDGQDTFSRVTKFNEAGDFVANASWSTDGTQLAIEYRKHSGIALVSINKDNLVETYLDVTSTASDKLSEYWPYAFTSWSDLILHGKDIEFNTYVSVNSQPVWVNQNKQVIFAASDKDGKGTLFMVNSNGSNLERFLPKQPGLIFMQRLSVDGRSLAYVRYPNWQNRDHVEIATVDIYTKEVVSLVLLSKSDSDDLIISGMDWSPDGKYLMFSSNHAGESDIYIISADGQGWRNITLDLDGDVASPTWKP